jgi:hypothetical protein
MKSVSFNGKAMLMDESTGMIYNPDGTATGMKGQLDHDLLDEEQWVFGDSYEGDEYDEEMEIFIMTAYFEGEEYQFEDWDESDIKHWTSLESDKKIKENEVEPAGWRMVEGKRIRKLARIANQ